MFWLAFTFVGALAVIAYSRSQINKIPSPLVNLNDIGVTTIAPGTPFQVVFGTVDIPDAVLTWYGDLSKEGDQYLLGAQFILCHGEIERVIGINFDGKPAWSGWATHESTNLISAPNLFGDGSGILGDFTTYVGTTNQNSDPYLTEHCATNHVVPGFRGLSHIVLKHSQLGSSPYLHKPSFRVVNTLSTLRAADSWVLQGGEVLLTPEYVWEVAQAGQWLAAFTVVGTPVDLVLEYAFEYTGVSPTSYEWKVHVHNTRNGALGYNPAVPPIWDDVLPQPWLRGQITIPASALFTGLNRIGIRVRDVGFQLQPARISSSMIYDMNPAHIIWNCLTNKTWGMGYLESDLDRTSFANCSLTLSYEGFGLSVRWAKQSTMEEFIREICRHIDGVLFMDRSTGQFKLKLIRNDYSPSNLITLGPTNIIEVRDWQSTLPGDRFNSVNVNFYDLSRRGPGSVAADDPAAVLEQKYQLSTTLDFPAITKASLANRVAQRELLALGDLVSCTLEANQEARNLEQGSVFWLDWPKYLDSPIIMRVTEILFGDGQSNRILINATQDVYSTPSNSSILSP